MGIFKPIETTKSNINNIEVIAGQMISCSDTGELYFDTIHNGRKVVSDLIMVEDDTIREGLSNPIPNKLYLVLSTNFIWMYNGLEWNQLTFPKPEIIMYTEFNIIIANDLSFEDKYLKISEDFAIKFNSNTDLLEVYINGILYTGVSDIKKINGEYYIYFGENMTEYTSYSTLTYKIYKNFKIQNFIKIEK